MEESPRVRESDGDRVYDKEIQARDGTIRYQLESNGGEVIFTKRLAWNFSEPKKDLSPRIRIAQVSARRMTLFVCLFV